MILLAVDPGHKKSAFVKYVQAHGRKDGRIAHRGIWDNDCLLDNLISLGGDVLLIEKVASFGMPVGEEVFETVFWSGRFAERWPGKVDRMTRNQVKMALCHKTAGVNDSVIRQRLIDIFGPGKEAAIGRKRNPGPLYGVKADEWAALALAVAWSSQNGLPSSRAAAPPARE